MNTKNITNIHVNDVKYFLSRHSYYRAVIIFNAVLIIICMIKSGKKPEFSSLILHFIMDLFQTRVISRSVALPTAE